MKKGFTLVELIVVISILSILGTIWFVMLWGYNKDARDAKRLADISNIEKSMELFFTKEWAYPDPTSFTSVTYSWAEVWNQWTIWDDVVGLLWNINYKPVDPLTKSEYSYSLLNTGEKYELGVLLEWNILASVLPNAYAAISKKWFSFVRWNFNKAIVEVSTWGLIYALAIPTIIVSDLTSPDIMNIIASKRLAYNGYSNIPETYSKLWYKTQWWFDFNSINPTNTILYQWTNISELSNWGPLLKTFSDKLIAAYSWTTLNTTWIYKQILWVDTTVTAQINTVISPLINQSLWLNLATTNTVVNNITPSCATPTPTVWGNLISINTWVPTLENQAWQASNSATACYNKCNLWFAWNACTSAWAATIISIVDSSSNAITSQITEWQVFDVTITGAPSPWYFDEKDILIDNSNNIPFPWIYIWFPTSTTIWTDYSTLSQSIKDNGPIPPLTVNCDSGYNFDTAYWCIL